LIRELSKYTSIYGKNAFAIIDQYFYDEMTPILKEDFEHAGYVMQTQIFNSEVTAERVENAANEAKIYAPDVIIAIGGGKTIDTAKAVADLCKVPVVIVPTSASTDAPTIALSVMYSEEGEHLCARPYDKNPDIVLMDSQIIADAPVRFLVAGMADALSTVFEARANQLSDSPNYVAGGYRRTKAGEAIAETCYDVLMKNGRLALEAAKHHVVTEALENIIEANTLLSGIGVENNACAGAHSICEGISILPEDKKTFHGEKVGFGVLCQLMLENAKTEIIDEVYTFCIDVGLPVTLDDLYIKNTSKNIMAIAEHSLKSYWDSEPVYVDANIVYSAIAAADAMGQKYKNKMNAKEPYCKGRLD
jgi:glycerol dehydrogenase